MILYTTSFCGPFRKTSCFTGTFLQSCSLIITQQREAESTGMRTKEAEAGVVLTVGSWQLITLSALKWTIHPQAPLRYLASTGKSYLLGLQAQWACAAEGRQRKRELPWLQTLSVCKTSLAMRTNELCSSEQRDFPPLAPTLRLHLWCLQVWKVFSPAPCTMRRTNLGG